MSTVRTAHLWLPGYVVSSLHAHARRPQGRTVHVLLCICDHFEPAHGQPTHALERRRVTTWIERLPRLAERVRDCRGRPLQYTFFYPQDQYRPEHLRELTSLCSAGFGEVEVHLHHDGDTSENLRQTLQSFTGLLAERHGCLTQDAAGHLRYGFIHGNWALDNAHPDGRWCGVNGELEILRETGCYADLTMPAAPDPCQTRTVNRIYHACSAPGRARCHDYGTPSEVGEPAPAGSLLMVQGPITINWRRRKFGLLPGLDNAALDALNPPTLQRFKRWVKAGISVGGRPEWIFVKLHAHGAIEENAETMLGPPMERFLLDITERYNDGTRYRLHFVTARELVNVIHAAETGHAGDASRFLDYYLPPPRTRRGQDEPTAA